MCKIGGKRIPVLLSALAIADGRCGDYSKEPHMRLDNQSVDTVIQRIQEKRGTYKKKE